MQSAMLGNKSLLLTAALVISGTLRADVFYSVCPDHAGGFGPFDYTKPEHRRQHLEKVNRAHFAPQVENLISGQSATLGGDIDYTIRAFPNHHRALNSLSNLSIKTKSNRPRGVKCYVDDYFERAIRFKPDDATVHMLYGVHLHRWKKVDDAKRQLEQAAKLAPNDANVAYNLGLVYADLKEWDKAMGYAKQAYAAGFPLPGLKDKLIKAGKWKEP
jgi:tetratricopeptide (TPR) repeat protein